MAVHYTDALIIGSGVGGLTAALKLARTGKRVAVISKRKMQECSTWYAQGGCAAVPVVNGHPIHGDSFDNHVEDTLKAGAGLCKRDIVRDYVEHAYETVIASMIGDGVDFTKAHKEHTNRQFPHSDSNTSTPAEVTPRSPQYPYSLHQEGGHSAPRIFHVSDYTGRAIMETLIKRAREDPNITIYEEYMAIDLIPATKLEKLHVETSKDGTGNGAGSIGVRLAKRTTGGGKIDRQEEANRCIGAYILDINQNLVHTFAASVTILATGGAARVYLYTSNPDTSTGDGIAMYFRMGFPVENMEFMQFHPTCFFNPNPKDPEQRRFLITEALRGRNIGGILVLRRDDKKDFIKELGYDPVLGSAGTRDVVARAIDVEMKSIGLQHVYLNVTPEVTGKTAEELKQGFPDIYAHCLECGVDLTKEPIPVVPAAHYTCGGIPTDSDGRTAVFNLYAIGECSCTGLHGANRLASNSLTEAAYFGARAAVHALSRMPADGFKIEGVPTWQSGTAVRSKDEVLVSHHWEEVRRLMWNLVGIARTSERLLMAKRRIELIQQEINRYYWHYFVTLDLLELRNIALVAEIMIVSALRREESRGAHCRLDHPKWLTYQPELEKRENGRKDAEPL